MDKATRQHIAGLEAELSRMQAELAALEAAGKTADLKAIFLREGIEHTAYKLQLEQAEALEQKRDMRFTSVGRSMRLRKGQK